MDKEDLLATAKKIAQSGVDYTPRHGAICPWCGATRLPVYRSMPWEGITRTRYHKCVSPCCIISKLEIGIKSIEEDLSGRQTRATKNRRGNARHE